MREVWNVVHLLIFSLGHMDKCAGNAFKVFRNFSFIDLETARCIDRLSGDGNIN